MKQKLIDKYNEYIWECLERINYYNENGEDHNYSIINEEAYIDIYKMIIEDLKSL